jgi:hypothetical protein
LESTSLFECIRFLREQYYISIGTENKHRNVAISNNKTN